MGPKTPCSPIRFAIRRGQKAKVGDPIYDQTWTHACVEGDCEWTDLRKPLELPADKPLSESVPAALALHKRAAALRA